MTEKLKTLMQEQAEAVDFVAPDLDAMVRDGDRTLRRRRSVVVAGGVAAAVVLAAGVALLPGRDGAVDRDPASGSDADPAPLTWVTGSTLHAGDGSTTDLGHDVRAYVRTPVGYVYADASGSVYSWRLGETSVVGRTDPRDLRLVADDDSSRVGWVERREGRSVVVVHDQKAGSTVHLDERSVPGMGNGPLSLVALDAGKAYWRDTRGLASFDLWSGDVEVLDPDGSSVVDVEDGTFATSTGQGTVVGRTPGEGVSLDEAYGSVGTLSPDGRYYSSEGDEQAVFDTTSGEQVRLDLTQRFATGYEWLDESTLAVLAAARPAMGATAQLLTCTIPEGSCRVVEDDLGTFADLEGDFALPTGDYAG